MNSLSTYSKLIEKEIRRYKFGKQPDSLYEPIRYLMSIGGKRLRPMLTLLAYGLYKPDVQSIIRYAVAVEAFHNFTLMHDDIMDNAPLRRGHATVHKKWNVSTAILSGDVMLVKVYDIFSTLEPAVFKKVIQAFNQCAAEVCEGQQWDMDFEKMNTVSERQYINMIKLKTAVLLGFSLELGAMLANAPDDECRALREFGTHIGIGFQLKDDLLDAYADPKKFGKQVGGDIIANKKTFLLIKALEQANLKQKKELLHWLTANRFNKKEKVNAVKAIFDELNIRTLTEKKINHFFEKGFSDLKTLDHTDSTSLVAFTESLIGRQH